MAQNMLGTAEAERARVVSIERMKPELVHMERQPSDNDNDTSSTLSDLEKRRLESVATAQTTFDSSGEAGLLYGRDGQMVMLPAKTQDPRDPLNLSMKHKILGLFCLCCFGALAASAELILGSMLPVFALQYAGVDPKILQYLAAEHLLPPGADALKTLSAFPNAPPIWKTYLLGSMPILIMGIANLIFIPLAISVGRRPVILGTGVLAIAGACWAGGSTSLDTHIAARCMQALGAGTVESLIPFIIQDTVHFHQRNTWISAVFAAQGTIIIGLGIAAPHLIIRLNWRWVYFITAAGAAFFLVGVFLFMPETRWYRTKAEMNGTPRPESEEKHHEPRTLGYNIRLQTGPIEFKKGVHALKDTLTTFFYPHIFFITMLNSVMIASCFAASFIVSPQLLAQPYNWPFLNLGLCLIPVIIGAACTALITGKFADVLANYLAKKRGRRLPENQLINLILPVAASIAGSLVFGLAGEAPDIYGWPVFLAALGLMSFGYLGAGTVGAVYVLECYPQLAGPALVNIASFRCILAFILSFYVSEMIVSMGYLSTMSIYTGLTGLFALCLPIVFVWGPEWRQRWPGPDR